MVLTNLAESAHGCNNLLIVLSQSQKLFKVGNHNRLTLGMTTFQCKYMIYFRKYTHTRGDPEIRGKRSPFLHRLTNRAEN